MELTESVFFEHLNKRCEIGKYYIEYGTFTVFQYNAFLFKEFKGLNNAAYKETYFLHKIIDKIIPLADDFLNLYLEKSKLLNKNRLRISEMGVGDRDSFVEKNNEIKNNIENQQRKSVIINKNPMFLRDIADIIEKYPELKIKLNFEWVKE